MSLGTHKSACKTIMSSEGTTMMFRVDEFVTKYNLEDEGKEELLKMLNESLSVISMEILKNVKVNGNTNKMDKVEGKKRFKSRKAEEYANEHGIEIDEFDMLEISKKDVENKIRERTKIKTNTSQIKNDEVEKKEKSEVKKVSKERVICCGINKKGEACKSTGTIQPPGAKKKYCFRHAEDFRSFECDSDSSDEEEELKEEEIKEEE